MWSDTGDVISVQYTGFSNLTSVSKSPGVDDASARKSLVSMARHTVEKGVKAANRYIQEQFLEDSRQQAIDLMLCGGHQRRSRGPSTLAAPREAVGGGALNEPVSIFAGTWNVNGKEVTEEYLSAWFSEPRAELPPVAAPGALARLDPKTSRAPCSHPARPSWPIAQSWSAIEDPSRSIEISIEIHRD